MKVVLLLGTLFVILLSGCHSERVNYTKALFKHIPDEPELLVMIRPNELNRLADYAMTQEDLKKMFDDQLNIDTSQWEHYKNVALEMLKALGAPLEQVETIGFLSYFHKPVLLLTGSFQKSEVDQKMRDLGFKQNDSGFFDYVYGAQKLFLPEDGLMILAESELIEDLLSIPSEHRLWNRRDFAEYRATSPLENALFVWTHPPEAFLSDFKYHKDLGDVSVAINLRENISMKTVIRVKDPQKTVYLYDLLFGVTSIAKGLFGDQPAYSPLVRGIDINQESNQVTASLVIPHDKIDVLHRQIKADFLDADSENASKFRNFLGKFK